MENRSTNNKHRNRIAAADFTSSDVNGDDDDDDHEQHGKTAVINNSHHKVVQKSSSKMNIMRKNAHNTQNSTTNEFHNNNESYTPPPPAAQQTAAGSTNQLNSNNTSDSSNEYVVLQHTAPPQPPPPPSARSFSTLLSNQHKKFHSVNNIPCSFATGNANVLLMANNNMTKAVKDELAVDLTRNRPPQQINYNTRLMQATHDSVLMLHRRQLQAEQQQQQQKVFADENFAQNIGGDDDQFCCSCCMPDGIHDDDLSRNQPEILLSESPEPEQQQIDGKTSKSAERNEQLTSSALAAAANNNDSIRQQSRRRQKLESSTTSSGESSDATTVHSAADDENHNQRWLTLAPGGNGAVRVFPPDFNAPCERSQIVPCTVTTPARVICEKFLSIPANALHVQFGSESAVRRLDMHECPLAIQNAYLKRIGFRTHHHHHHRGRNANDDEHYYRNNNDHSPARSAADDEDDEQDVRQLGLSHELTYFVRFYAGKPNKDNTFSRRLLSASLLVSTATKLSAVRKLLYNSSAANHSDAENMLLMARIGTSNAKATKGGINSNKHGGRGGWQSRQCVLSGTRLLVYPEEGSKTRNLPGKINAGSTLPPIIYQLARGDVQVVPVMVNPSQQASSNAILTPVATGNNNEPWQTLATDSYYENEQLQTRNADIDCSCNHHHMNYHENSHHLDDETQRNFELSHVDSKLLKRSSTLLKSTTSKPQQQMPSYVIKLTTFRPQSDEQHKPSSSGNNMIAALLPSLLHGNNNNNNNTEAAGSSFFDFISHKNKKKNRNNRISTTMPNNNCMVTDITAISTSSVTSSSSSSSSSTTSAADSALAASVSSTEANALISRGWPAAAAAAARADDSKRASSSSRQQQQQQQHKSILLGFQTEAQMLRWLARLKRATAKQSHVADLSNNHLEYLPENLFACQEGLMQLNLRNNMLKERPIEEDIFTIGWLDDLPRFTALQSLNLANNELHVFPSSVCRLSQLTELNISSNAIEELSPAIRNLSRLRILQLHANRLTDLPLEMAYLHNLSVLVLSFNRFQQVPQVLASMPQIDSLIINGNRIAEITYEACSRLRNITKIDLRLNRLQTPPLVQQQHKMELRSQLAPLFNSSNTSLRFDLLSGTTHLDLRSNRELTHLDLQALHQLQYFNASYCSLKTVFLSGTSLLLVDISNNDLQQLLVTPPPNRLVSLNLSRNSLAKLPSWVGDIRHLEHLDCSYNCLIGLPHRILYNGYSIRILSASHNQLHCLPDRVENCVLLEELDVAHNRLTSLPEPLLAGSHKLRVLNITHNRFSHLPLPNAFVDVNRIQFLYASFNVLDDRVWEVVKLLPRLRTLHLAHNRLRQCPSKLFENWPSLEELNVSGNSALSSLPNDLFVASHLTSLYAHSNNLHRLPDTSQNLRLKNCDLSFNPLEFHINRAHRRRDEQQQQQQHERSVAATKVHFAQDVLPSQKYHARDEAQHRQNKRKSKSSKTVSEQSQQRALVTLGSDPHPERDSPLPMWQCGAAETSGHRTRMCITRIKQPAFCMQPSSSSSTTSLPSQRKEEPPQNSHISALFALIDGGQCAEVPDKVQHLLPTLINFEWSKLYSNNQAANSVRSRKRRNTMDFDRSKQQQQNSTSRRCRTRERSSVRHSSSHRRSSSTRRWAPSTAPFTNASIQKKHFSSPSTRSISARYCNHLRKAILHAHLHLRDAGQRVGASCVVAHIYCPFSSSLTGNNVRTLTKSRSTQQESSSSSPQLYLATANLGGAEAIISRANGEIVPLSQPFRPSAVSARELDRVCAGAGGIITDNDRVNASSQHTRLLGAHFLYPTVIAEPHCSAIALDASDEFMIIANEAFWLACGHEEAAALVREKVFNLTTTDSDDAQQQRVLRNMSDARWATQIAKALVDLALCYGGGKSNLSVMVVLLNIPSTNNNVQKSDEMNFAPSDAKIEGVAECSHNAPNVTTNSIAVQHDSAASSSITCGGIGTLRSDGTLFYDSTAYIEPPAVDTSNHTSHRIHSASCSPLGGGGGGRVGVEATTPLPTAVDFVASSSTTTTMAMMAMNAVQSSSENVLQEQHSSYDYGVQQRHPQPNNTAVRSSCAALRSSNRRLTQSIQPTELLFNPKSPNGEVVQSFEQHTISETRQQQQTDSNGIAKLLCHMSNNNNNTSALLNAKRNETDTAETQQADVDSDAANFLRRHRSSLRVVPSSNNNNKSNQNNNVSSAAAEKPSSQTSTDTNVKPPQKSETDNKKLHVSVGAAQQTNNKSDNSVVSRWKLQQQQTAVIAAAAEHHSTIINNKNQDDDNASVVYEKVGDDAYYENIYSAVVNTTHQAPNKSSPQAAPPSPPPLPPDVRKGSANGDIMMLAKLKRRKDVLSAAGDAERRAKEDKERKQKCLLDELQTVLMRRRLLSDGAAESNNTNS